MSTNLLIAAQPTVPLILMVTGGEDAKQIDNEKCFYPALIERVRAKMTQYDIESVTVYGPRTYVIHIGDDIKRAFPNENVKLAFAGEEH